MPFIRLSDDYFDNPKFEHLSDGAFRLWHQALAYCRRHSTDGLFSFKTMRGWSCYTRRREQELTAPHKEGANPLWVLIPKFGYKLHDYLDWNPSREEEAVSRMGAAERQRRRRHGVTGGVTTRVTNGVGSGDGDKALIQQVPERRNEEWTAETFMDLFRGQWKAKYGYECSLMLNPLQFERLAIQLSKIEEVTIRTALTAFFASGDPFVVKSKHALGLFMREPTKYLVADVAPVAEPDVWARIVAAGPRKRSYEA